MNKADFASSIAKAWTHAKALEIEEAFSVPVALEASESFKRKASSPDMTYEELYLEGLKGSNYNILLKDFAFFQFGYGKVDGVRFAYYPNPFIGASQDAVSDLAELREYVDEGIIDIDEFLHKVSDIRYPQHPPLVRYEFSKSQYVECLHPFSHFHLGFHGENRWSLKRELTPHAFCLMVMRLFYLSFWQKVPPIVRNNKEETMDDAMHKARSECRILGSDEFSEKETKLFHFF